METVEPAIRDEFIAAARAAGCTVDQPPRYFVLITGPYGIPVVEQAEPGVCCGFGGSTSITSPHVSEGIAERKLASLKAAGVSTVVTDNPGCVLHLRGVVDAAGIDLDVRHPAEILAERLRG